MSRKLARVDVERYDVVFVEFPLSGRALMNLRRRNPSARILTRSENAELLHRADWIRVMGPSRASVKLAFRAGLNTAAEAICGRYSDAVLPISEWEARCYWPRLTGRSKIRWLPYHVPDDFLGELTPRDEARELICVCLTSTLPNPLIEDSVRGFRRAVASLGNSSKEWRFLVTGEISRSGDARIEHTGMLTSPGALLTKSRLVALFSDYGYGFKTKLLDAIVAGNRVAVTPRLYQRMPRLLDPWTVCVDPSEPGAFAAALERAKDPPLPGNPNALLRQRHDAVLDALLDLDGMPAKRKNDGHITPAW